MKEQEGGMRNETKFRKVFFLRVFQIPSSPFFISLLLVPLFLVFFLLSPISVFADEKAGAAESAGGSDADKGLKTYTELQFQFSTLPEARFLLNEGFIFPFLQGSGPLTRDNNITAVLSTDVTPVSVNGSGEVNLTPVAFFFLSAGGRAGSGWNIPMGNGIGINAPEDKNAPVPGPGDPPRKAKIYGDVFDGLLWSTWGAGTFQFDLAAVIPGDWNHVVFQSRQEFRYAAYTRAGTGDAWIFENDDGENQNGWIYYASYVLGYRMPQSPVLDTIAFMAEMEKNLYNTPGGDRWGDSLGNWVFSELFNFTITPRFSASLALQMRTRRNNGISNFDNPDYYYRDYTLQDSGGQRRVLFYRAAVILSYKIR